MDLDRKSSLFDILTQGAAAEGLPIQVIVPPGRLLEFNRPNGKALDDAKTEGVKWIERIKAKRAPEPVLAVASESLARNGLAFVMSKFDAGGYEQSAFDDDTQRYVGVGERNDPMDFGQWLTLASRFPMLFDGIAASFEAQQLSAMGTANADRFEAEKKGSKTTRSTENDSE